MHEGHRKRIREKYRRNGLEGFADHEVLELLLFYANKRSDTNETAHRLIKRFGSLSAVLEAPYDELVQVEDIGDVAATLITMVPALFRRYSADKVSSITEISSSQQAIDYSKPKFFGLSTERGALIFLDSQNRVKNFLFVCEGSLNATSLDIRKCVQLAL
ncbi:MAG: DNA repair protein RadC, partial [Clostridia bacterium]|nr:DNA repair protein RadC [Clostridia bacterium]